jgi:mannose-6-phosphate isomerase-like protein (cupin superfamily)
MMQGKVVKMNQAMTWEIPEAEPNHRFMGLIFERDLTPTTNLSAGFVILPPKQEQRKLSAHEGVEEIYLVLQGTGQFVLDNDVVDVEQGTAVYVSPGCRHRAVNTGDEEMRLFWVNTPPVFGPNKGYLEIVKDWKRIR